MGLAVGAIGPINGCAEAVAVVTAAGVVTEVEPVRAVGYGVFVGLAVGVRVGSGVG